ncbi:MAG: DVUA0089 family protein [Pseudomonadota bacterium]
MAAVAAAWAGAAAALTVTETPDAGSSLDTAFVLPAGTTAIEGTIENTSISDVDLYRFSLIAPTRLTLRMLFLGADANLLLFNGLGQGLAANDDNGVNSGCDLPTGLAVRDSCLSVDLAAGEYFLGAGDNNTAAFATAADAVLGPDFFSNDAGILPRPTPETLALLGNEDGERFLNNEGAYRIEFSAPVSSVPLPAGAWLLLSGLGVLRLAARGGA